ncbi:MAG: 50S ribosomal protein L11 methyltransferase [candidate division Zixibacteria bacterium]|nr:50S ribosomal protein L11 methyltransferase [candidate division Zixibacteria bacterium]
MMTASDRPEYRELRLEVPRQHADAVCDFIIQYISGGLVLDEEEHSGHTGITFYVPHREVTEIHERLAQFVASLEGMSSFTQTNIISRVMKGSEWEEAYRKSVTPVMVGDDIVVRPPWTDPMPSYTHQIIIEPKMAFGTGRHETTRSCLAVIRNRFQSGSRFLDLGCGSGILSILAAQMGATYIKAIDYDVTAIDNCRENFAVNGIAVPNDIIFGSIEKTSGDLPYDFVCSNIIKTTILDMLPRLKGLTKPGGLLVMSGLLNQDEADISSALRGLGLMRFTIMRDGDWMTYTVSLTD